MITLGDLIPGDRFRKWDGKTGVVSYTSPSGVYVHLDGDRAVSLAASTEVLEIIHGKPPVVTVTKSPKKKSKAGGPRQGTISAIVFDSLRDEVPFEEVFKRVKMDFPKSAFHKGHFNWYKNSFKKRFAGAE